MKVHQQVLFVGLGGTGLAIGAQLERRLRQELCGPDGTALRDLLGEDIRPFELPSCLQFVYADLSQTELDQLDDGTDPHIDAIRQTRHLARELLPAHATYSDLARSLRQTAPEHVVTWLPATDGEPLVGPLNRGAGQLPTVGRAALFESLRQSIRPGRRPLDQAVAAMARSTLHLSKLGGGDPNAIDVFVAFSVAGGTGCGIFYDYLHLLAKVFTERKPTTWQIYPLVLMPSTFDEGLGGGRFARLNSGRALLDLFRLVDDQNANRSESTVGSAVPADSVHVSYPDDEAIRIEANKVQTAFLFSRSPGMTRDDLHRSIVSLMLSLTATEPAATSGKALAIDQHAQTFAASFINASVNRGSLARSGVGNRGASTGLVASMTVPVDELADIVSFKLLAEAVHDWATSPAGGAEANSTLIGECFTISGVEPLSKREGPALRDPSTPPVGVDAIGRELNNRTHHMKERLHELATGLPGRVAAMATEHFHPDTAVEHVLSQVDLFRGQRVILGDTALAAERDKRGFLGVLAGMRNPPEPPDGLAAAAPTPPRLKNRFLRRLRWNDSTVRKFRTSQEDWYRWRIRSTWNAAWNDQAPAWEPKVRRTERKVRALAGAFLEHERRAEAWLSAHISDLYRTRTGVTYMLPEGRMEDFYRTVIARFVTVNGARFRLGPGSSAGAIARAMLPADAWREAYERCTRFDDGPTRSVAYIRDQLKQAIKVIFAHEDGDAPALLPRLSTLLERAAGVKDQPGEEVRSFRHRVEAMVPGGFDPPGSGEMSVLISYPGAADEQIERFLGSTLTLPIGAGVVHKYQPAGTEAITVLFFRTNMSVTEVPEMRSVLREWSAAVNTGREEDYLRWRQRVSFDFGYLMTARWHREKILHRFLCAIWNGQVEVVAGDPESPEEIDVLSRMDGQHSMRLRLRRHGRASSWGSLVRAYEAWTIEDDALFRSQFCETLMGSRPTGLEESPRPPSKLYQLVTGMAAEQVALLGEHPHMAGNTLLPAYLEFWRNLMPAALSMPFTGVSTMIAPNLNALAEVVGPA